MSKRLMPTRAEPNSEVLWGLDVRALAASPAGGGVHFRALKLVRLRGHRGLGRADPAGDQRQGREPSGRSRDTEKTHTCIPAYPTDPTYSAHTTCLLTYYSPTYVLTCLLVCLPAYLPTYLPIYLLTYLPTSLLPCFYHTLHYLSLPCFALPYLTTLPK
jgi:hypothetical protein